MDDRELALELVKLYLQYHRERVEFSEFLQMYLAALAAVKGIGIGQEEQPVKDTNGDDSLFDFKEPLSLSKK